jgi:hypothetical protein
VEAAIAKLGSHVFQERQAACAELLSCKEKAYPSLLEAAQSSDPEVARRAEELLGKLRDMVPDDVLEAPTHDVVHTLNSKIAGRITVTSFKVHTSQFGELDLKLADARGLRSLDAPELEVVTKNVLPDPGNLSNYAQQTNQTFRFRVTGSTSGSLYGTDYYTTDSTLAVAAVHAGVLKPGQAGIVKVTILPPQQSFTGSLRHGITSSSWGSYPAAYRFKR